MSVCLCFSCGGSYRGDFCQYDNPCRNDLNRCVNGGTCQVLESLTSIGFTCACPLGKPLTCLDIFIGALRPRVPSSSLLSLLAVFEIVLFLNILSICELGRGTVKWALAMGERLSILQADSAVKFAAWPTSLQPPVADRLSLIWPEWTLAYYFVPYMIALQIS